MLLFLKNIFELNSDFAQARQLSFQTPGSVSMELIIDLHNYVMFFLCWILGFVLILWLLSLNVTVLSFFIFVFNSFIKFTKETIEKDILVSDFKYFLILCKLYIKLSLYRFFDIFLKNYSIFVSLFTNNSNFFTNFAVKLKKLRSISELKLKAINAKVLINNSFWTTPAANIDSIFSFTKTQLNLLFFTIDKKVTHSKNLEIIWTIIPSLILLIIAGPSLWAIYALEEPAGHVFVVVKVIGHQWYWSYEVVDDMNWFGPAVDSVLTSNSIGGFQAHVYDSYMLPTSELKAGQLRLLEVDNVLYLPTRTPIQLIITADDVLHSWAVPSLGVKVDAVPGRLNSLWCFIFRIGEFYGQCSELCGIQHGFMPIKVISYAV